MAPSPSVFLASVAQRTKRLRFGPLVYTLALYHPLRVAEEICMLDQLSRGRYLVGVGKGVSPIEIGYYGGDTSKTEKIFAECFAVMMQALTQKVVNYEGEHFRFKDVPMELTPLQKPHPPLWYGVTLPSNSAWPAENHVNIVALGLRDNTQAIIKAYRETRTQKGFDQDGTLAGVSRHIVVADTDEAALAIARRAYPRWRQSFRWLFNRHGTEPRVIVIYPETFDGLIALNNGIAGSPETVRRFIAAEIEANNCNYFVPQMVFGDMTLPEALRSIELFGKEVMPAFAK
jgi:alkanesulfonate monooxygenase SsuD/methylene tetrahydromethanopterin reductase-like flavin-dependent oxidoreductase (luciferase family)